MRIALGFFAPVAAAIIGFWWWLGITVAMPPSPLGPGEMLPCVSYAPFRGAQNPADPTLRVSAVQIEEDFAILAQFTGCVRTYSTTFGLDQVPDIARKHGLTMLLGLWLGRDPAQNHSELEAGIALARKHSDVIKAVIVGNEVLLRKELPEAALIDAIRTVKARVPVPVTYADVWELWLQHRAVAGAVDFVTVHLLPYWEDIPTPPAGVVRHLEETFKIVSEVFAEKEILVGEVGWPSAGRMREGALPSPANEARIAHDVLAWAKTTNRRVNLIEAFDQPWKRQLEGTVGGHWGLIEADRSGFKFAWGMPVTDHPWWRLQAAAGVVSAALIFAAGIGTSRRNATSTPSVLAGVSIIALSSGALLGWAVENVPRESLGIGGWTRSLVMLGLALFCPLAGAAALGRGVSAPCFSRVLDRRSNETPDMLGHALGFLAVILAVATTTVALGLALDPRYRDFPFAPLTSAVVPYLALAGLAPRAGGRRSLAETVAAAMLGGASVAILFNEGLANWQALWTCAVLAALALTLARARDGQSPAP